MRAVALATMLSLSLLHPMTAQEVDKLDWGEFRWERDRGTTSGTLHGSADSAYRVLRGIMKELDLTIKPQDADAANHEFLVRRQKLLTRLGKERISRYLSCGEGMTGPNADAWYVYLTIHAAIGPAGAAKSRFQMALTAEAVDVPGGRSERVACSSTGMLEMEIVKRMRDAFPGS